MLCRFLKIPGQLSLFHGLVLKMWKKSKIFYEFQDFFTINFFEFFLICSRELLFLLLQCCISAKENVIESRFIACYWNNLRVETFCFIINVQSQQFQVQPYSSRKLVTDINVMEKYTFSDCAPDGFLHSWYYLHSWALSGVWKFLHVHQCK